MKKFFLFVVISCATSGLFAQTLFTYGNNAVTRDEFLRAYNKNKAAVTDKTLALKEYLDLYVKFKLKVKAAKDLHIDTLASLANDLKNFRTQIEENYLNDEARVNALTQEAFVRSQEDLHIAHVFFPFTNSDTLGAFTAATSASRTTGSSVKWEDLGFITVFSLPYAYENIVYGLQPGGISKPYRSKSGYHLFKNIEKRKAFGKIKTAQILIAFSEGAKDEEKAGAARIADSVYKALLAGADFSEAAKNISNDKMTYLSGGVMPEYGVGKYEPAFEDKVFALQKDGAITHPFQTQFGYHIVKRLSKTEIPQDKNNDSYLYGLKQQVLQDTRIASAKEKFLQDVLKKLNYKKNTALTDAALWKVTDEMMATEKIQGRYNGLLSLFFINGQAVKVNDWVAYLKNYKASGAFKGEGYPELMQQFTSSVALENYKKRLPDFNPEFKYQIQEFKDGNMLFEVMERNVWTKASSDTTGLKNYYLKQKSKYTWNESADAVLISCSDGKVAATGVEKMKNGKGWKQLAEENTPQMQGDSGRYELTQLPVKPGTNFSAGMVTEPLVNETDGTATFVKIIRIYPANQQRSFEEARGLVINDYQLYLEEKWIDQLKKKYPVKINEKVFQSLL